MKIVKLQNQRLIKILTSITDAVYEPQTLESLSNFVKEKPPESDPLYCGLHGTSIQYLEHALENHDLEMYGWPRLSYSLCWHTLQPQRMGADPIDYFPELSKVILKNSMRIQNMLGAERQALTAFYPPGGYMGWHHNGNAPGYNILMSYTPNGSGTFTWRKDDGTIVEMKDEPGWNVKVGYYQDITKDEGLFWHTAYTDEPRITIAWIADYEPIWLNAIEIIEGIR